jgi:hypothetical protein
VADLEAELRKVKWDGMRGRDFTAMCDTFDKRTELLEAVLKWHHHLPAEHCEQALYATGMDLTDYLDLVRRIKEELGR